MVLRIDWAIMVPGLPMRCFWIGHDTGVDKRIVNTSERWHTLLTLLTGKRRKFHILGRLGLPRGVDPSTGLRTVGLHASVCSRSLQVDRQIKSSFDVKAPAEK